MVWKDNYKRWIKSPNIDQELKSQLDEIKADEKQLEPEFDSR